MKIGDFPVADSETDIISALQVYSSICSGEIHHNDPVVFTDPEVPDSILVLFASAITDISFDMTGIVAGIDLYPTEDVEWISTAVGEPVTTTYRPQFVLNGSNSPARYCELATGNTQGSGGFVNLRGPIGVPTSIGVWSISDSDTGDPLPELTVTIRSEILFIGTPIPTPFT